MKIKDIKKHQKKIDSIEKEAKCGMRYVEYIKHYFKKPKTEKKEIFKEFNKLIDKKNKEANEINKKWGAVSCDVDGTGMITVRILADVENID